MTRTYLACADGFSADACARIIALGEAAPGGPGPLYGGSGEEVDRSRRDVWTTLHARAPETAWLFDRLDALFAVGAVEFGLDVAPIREPVQVVRYDAGSHFALWHSDAGLDAGDARLISISVELSEAGDYGGGTLEVVPDLVGRPRTLPRGGAHLFPSRALHRVTPVTRGRRWALVAWTGAPAA